jgi:toxin ParE1/3/4
LGEYRLSDPASAQIVEVLAWSEENFGMADRERYGVLLFTAMQDLADDPDRPGVEWKRVRQQRIGVYHIHYSRKRVPDAPGRVKAPRHFIIFRRGGSGVVDILGVMYDGMLPRRTLRRIVHANEAQARKHDEE